MNRFQRQLNHTLNKIADSTSSIAATDEAQTLHAKCSEYAYEQSSKFSDVARTLIIGIIGSTWAASLKDGNFTEVNRALLMALISSCLYLAIDAIHYYIDSNSYKKICDYIASQKSLEGVQEQQHKAAEISKRFFQTKFLFLIISTGCFIIGFYIRYI